jgi:poly-gamma-glutamate capsule biosynthesis protein CapA/YwtB (metallophosphatase superfamily)
MQPLSLEERHLRREAKRRHIRHRRIGALAFLVLVALGLVAGLAISGARAGADTTTTESTTTETTSTTGTTTTVTGTTGTTTTATGTTGTTTTTTTTTTRGRLGSGRAVTLAFGGDVHFEGIVRSKLNANPTSVMSAIAPVLEKADLAMVNLETTVSYRGAPTPGKTYTFRAPPSAFQALKAGGVDLATVANNHGVDYGLTSFLDTLRYAKRYHFPLVGGGRNAAQAYAPYSVTIKGQRIAILGASQVIDSNLIASWTAEANKPGIASAYDMARLTSAVREARKRADTVVVYLHFGTERQGCPSSMQIAAARKLIAAGADIVVGSHAHQQQGAGRLGRAFVDYGLGNFVWYSQNSAASVTTGVLKVTVTGRRIDGYQWVPARIVGGSPTPLGGSARSAALSSWRGLRGCTNLSR